MYDELVKTLRETDFGDTCVLCEHEDMCKGNDCIIIQAADAIEQLSNAGSAYGRGWTLGYDAGREESKPRWIPVTERLPECDLGAEVGNIEWISCGMVHAGCFGRGGEYRDAYFRTWTDAGEGMDAKGADYWRAVTLPEPPKEE